MAVITSATSGNFSDPTTWVGGVVPGPSDNARADTGHNVTIDVNTTVIDIQGISTGRFIMGEGITLTGNVLGSQTGGNETLSVTVTTNCTIIGDLRTISVDNTYCARMTGTGILNIQGVVGGGTTGSNRRGLIITSACTVNILGDVVTQINSGATTYNAIIITGDCILNITGNVYPTSGPGNSGSAIISSSSNDCQINVIGNVQSVVNSAISAPGINAKVNIIGNILPSISTQTTGLTPTVYLTGINSEFSIIGNIYGSLYVSSISTSGANSIIQIKGNIFSNDNTTTSNGHTIRSSATIAGRGVIIEGDIYYGQNGSCPIQTVLLKMIPTTNGKTVYTKLDGTIYTQAALTAVDFNIPFEEDVRNGVVYGDSAYTGTLIVPDPSNVRKGVTTDNTVGTADLTAEDFLNAIETSSNDVAVRLRNVATVASTGGQLASYNV